MTNKYGKELRKIRVDNDENALQMAKKLDISVSYLSAIESGKRSIPQDLTNKIIETYKLAEERSKQLRQAENEEIDRINIKLNSLTLEQRKLMVVFSRKLTNMSDEECLNLMKKIND